MDIPNFGLYRNLVQNSQISVEISVLFGQILVNFEKSYLLIRKSSRVVPPVVLKVIESSFI